MTHRSATASRPGQKLGFFREIIGELRKVSWLTRREAIYLTVLVLIISAATGLVLGALDYGFSRLVELFIGR